MAATKLPKYSYLFLISKQPSKQAWEALQFVASEWNESRKAQLTADDSLGEETLTITFENYKVQEKIEFDEKLSYLKTTQPIAYHAGIVDSRVNDDYIGSDFIHLGGQYYDEGKFFINGGKVFIENLPCNQCGKYPLNLQLNGTPIVDSSFLDKAIEPNTNFNPIGLDFIGVSLSGLMVSDKVKNLIESSGAKGAIFLPLIDKDTKSISERIYLISAEKSITDFCTEHTPRSKNAICQSCGSCIGEIYGYPYVSDNWLNGDEIFSKSKNRLAGVYFSKRLYELFIEENLRGLYVLHGLNTCSHAIENYEQ